jgi:hypothetical protein
VTERFRGSKTRTNVEATRPSPIEARATRVVIATFGILAGLAAMEHGIGELSQGSSRHGSLLIQSWPDTAAIAVLVGEPALTVLPKLFASRVLTVIIALALAIWSVAFVQRHGTGLVLILLSIVLLLRQASRDMSSTLRTARVLSSCPTRSGQDSAGTPAVSGVSRSIGISHYPRPDSVCAVASGDVEPNLVQTFWRNSRHELDRHVRPSRRLGHYDSASDIDDHRGWDD